MLLKFILISVGLVFLSACTATDSGHEDVIQQAEQAYVTQDYETAFHLLVPIADDGDKTAQFMLGDMSAKGQGVEADYEKSVLWLRRSAKQGYPKAQYMLGMYLVKGTGVEQNLDEAANWISKAAQQGMAKAQFQLGLMYEEGKGVMRDNARALEKNGKKKGNKESTTIVVQRSDVFEMGNVGRI